MLSFYISFEHISAFFSFHHGYTGCHQRKNSGLSLLFALWICRWLKGKWLSLLIALFLQRHAIKWWNWKKKQEQKDCNKITLLTTFLFISWACCHFRNEGRWTKNVRFAKWIILFAFRSYLTGSTRECWLWDKKKVNFVHVSVGNIFAKPLSCTPSRTEEMLLTICKYFWNQVWFCYIYCSRERMWNMRHSAIMSFQLLPSQSCRAIM